MIQVITAKLPKAGLSISVHGPPSPKAGFQRAALDVKQTRLL